jgi:aminodeoxyfutalosine deaminase
MNIEAFVRSMPKVALNVRLEGAFRKSVLMMIAEQNEIASQVKKFDDMVAYWDDPDPKNIEAMAHKYAKWLHHPDDLTRLVYDAGFTLAKDNVRYAEISINPSLYADKMGFDEFLKAVNDGRSRAERGWGIQIRWVLSVYRDEPRTADDTLRSAALVNVRKNGVVGFALYGAGEAQPAGQFERAFNTAKKKEVPTSLQVGDMGLEGLSDVSELQPDRVVDGWELLGSPETQGYLIENDVPLVVSVESAKRMSWIEKYSDYPLRELLDRHLPVVIGAELPELFGCNLSDEYLLAMNECGLTLEEIEQIALDTVDYAYLDADEKEKLKREYAEAYQELHTTLETASEVEEVE